MNWLQKVAQGIPSRADFEDMVQRAFNIHREYLREDGIKTWRQWLQEDTDYNISLTIESDYNIYDKYLRNLPEELTAIDLIDMYRKGNLPERQRAYYSYQPDPIYPANINKKTYPWSPQEDKYYTAEEAQKIYFLATQRMIPSKKEEILEARKQLYIAFNTDSQLPEKISISQTNFNKKMRAMAGLSVGAKRLEESLNYDIPKEHQWTGITNSTFMGRQSLSHEDLDKFVKNIEVTNEGRQYWGRSGEALRNYVANTFMSIDTRISYDDLSFKIGKCKRARIKSPRGLFEPNKNLITVDDVNPNTVAHEIGHYLDAKWGKQFGVNYMSIGTYVSPNNKILKEKFPDEQLKWAKKFYDFVAHLMDYSDISSEYTQSRSEVFARFVDRFVNWVNKKSNRYTYEDASYNRNDKFSEQDFRAFVRILQEKSYLNSAFPYE